MASTQRWRGAGNMAENDSWKPGRTLAYELLSESGPDHDKLFQFRVLLDDTEIGRGQGRTKKEAEQSAASAALEALKK